MAVSYLGFFLSHILPSLQPGTTNRQRRKARRKACSLLPKDPRQGWTNRTESLFWHTLPTPAKCQWENYLTSPEFQQSQEGSWSSTSPPATWQKQVVDLWIPSASGVGGVIRELFFHLSHSRVDSSLISLPEYGSGDQVGSWYSITSPVETGYALIPPAG